jgi:hypothetical protein
VLVQLRTGRGDHLDHAFLPCVQVGAATRQQPRPPSPEQPDAVKTELNRVKTTDPEQGRGHLMQIPIPQDRVRDVRHVSAVGVRLQARHPDPIEMLPQRPHGTLGATVEE